MLVKCQMCKLKDTDKKDMKTILVGVTRPVPKNFHHACYDAYLEEKAFKEKEVKELDVLVETIYKIYGVKSLPDAIYVKIQALRNGTNTRTKSKKSKKGYSYLIIEKTFNYCSDSIEYANNNKNFNGSLMNALSYGLAIVADKLSYIENRETIQKEKKRRADAIAEKAIEKMDDVKEDTLSSYEKAKLAKSEKKKQTDKFDYFE